MISKCTLIFIAAVFVIPLIHAEEIIFGVHEQKNYKGITIELVSVGSSGSVALQVDKLTFSLPLYKERSVSGLNITLLETTSDTAKISIIQTVQCLNDEDCNDFNECTNDSCTVYHDCAFNKIDECEENICSTPGERGKDNQYYCSLEKTWQKRKPFNQGCTYNYECISDICQDTICAEDKEGKQMAIKNVLIILIMIIILKGAFLFYFPEKAKHLLRELSFQKRTNIRTMGIAVSIIGILILVWILT